MAASYKFWYLDGNLFQVAYRVLLRIFIIISKQAIRLVDSFEQQTENWIEQF